MPVAVALGSNRCHGRLGRPPEVVRAAARALAAAGVGDMRLSPVIETAPLGPSRRRYANAVLTGSWAAEADALFVLLKATERAFGRRPGGRAWGPRVLDCDLIAFGAAVIVTPHLRVPHPRMATRDFVLKPMQRLWPAWRHPLTGLTVRQMAARLAKARPVDCAAAAPYTRRAGRGS